MYYERQQIPIEIFILSHMAACNTLAKKKYNEAYKKKSAIQHSSVILKNECQSLHNTNSAMLFLPYPLYLWELDQASVRTIEETDSVLTRQIWRESIPTSGFASFAGKFSNCCRLLGNMWVCNAWSEYSLGFPWFNTCKTIVWGSRALRFCLVLSNTALLKQWQMELDVNAVTNLHLHPWFLFHRTRGSPRHEDMDKIK